MTTLKVGQIKVSVSKALAYIVRDDATRDGLLVSTNAAVIDPSDWRALAREFAATAEQGVSSARAGSVLAHHFIQSFDPQEQVSPELAHQIGEQLAQRITKGAFEFVVATHVDKDHVHNHIMVNATSFTHGRKFRMGRSTLGAFRTASDELSVAHGLRALPEPKQRALRSMADLQLMVRGGSTKERLRVLIDDCAAVSRSWEEFESRMMMAGVCVTRPPGGRGSVTFDPEWTTWKVRDFRLGHAYTEGAVMARIAKARVEPLTVDRSMFVSETDDRLQVYVPGTGRRLVLSVAWDNVVMHGRTARVYVASEGLHPLATPSGGYARTVTTRELFQWFQVPAPTPTSEVAANGLGPIYDRVLTRRETRDQIRDLLARADAVTRWGQGEAAATAALARRDEAQLELAGLVVAAADIMSTGGNRAELISVQNRAQQLDTELRQLDADVSILGSAVSAGNGRGPEKSWRATLRDTARSHQQAAQIAQRAIRADQLDDVAKDRSAVTENLRSAIRRDAALAFEADAERRTPPDERTR